MASRTEHHGTGKRAARTRPTLAPFGGSNPPVLTKPREPRWGVARVHDDGRVRFVVTGLTPRQAERRAGRMRDAMTDAECGEDWNYLARRQTPVTGVPRKR